jgi:proton glutamate symport protein
VRSTYSDLTKWSLVALLGGLGLGLVGHLSGIVAFAALGTVAQGLGELWISALRMITLPLALAMMLAATSSARPGSVGSLGGRAILLILVALVLMGAIAFTTMSALMSRYAVTTETITAMTSGVVVPASIASAGPMSFGSWIGGLMPRNLFDAAARGDMLPLLIFAMLFGFAITRLPDEHRIPLARASQAFSQVMQVMVGWLVLVMPAGVFALSYVMTLKTGDKLAGMLGVYLLAQPAITLLCVMVFYAATAVFGQTPIAAFARAVLPAQLVAVSTRSSVAALPALVDGGREHLRLSATATNFLLPLNVSIFRVSETITGAIKLVFLAHIFGVPLHASTLTAFLITVIIFNFSGTGTPNSGGGIGYRMVPVYAAAGVPIEGVMVLEAVETIPDIFATLANVTGQMSATVILSRYAAREEAGVDIRAEPQPG